MSVGSEVAPVTLLLGAPNSGKTTVYNWLTGARFRTVNYPGSTVDYAVGMLQARYGESFPIVDTPGLYSLFPKTPEEEISRRLLYGAGPLSVGRVAIVLDATQLSRQLYLVEQVRRTGIPFLVILTMLDLVAENREKIDQRVLAEFLGCSIIGVDGRLGGGIHEAAAALRALPNASTRPQELPHWSPNEQSQVAQAMEDLAARVRTPEHQNSGHNDHAKAPRHLVQDRTHRIDRWALHPIFGGVLFFLAMSFLFSSIFWLAAPLMDLVDQAFGWLASWTSDVLPEGLLAGFVSDGVITSVGAVLVFVPQIFILFLGIGLFEDSGYLARAAALVDRPLSWLGMNGRSFVPLLSGFACAVPAMAAARTIGSRRERWLTLAVIPLMTCSARLPVYALLLSFVFFGEPAWKPGLALTGLYFASIFLGGLAAAWLNRVLPEEARSLFMLELPIYRRPIWRVVLRNALTRTQSYVRRAGPVIFLLSIMIWMGTTFPSFQSSDPTERLEKSYLGQAGQVIEPVFQPMGVDWRVGVSLLSAFAAREVFVSSLAVMFHLTEDADASGVTEQLLASMQTATHADGRPLFTVPSIASLLVFFMIALQCLSTFAMAWRETQSRQFAIIQLIALNLVAYGAAVAVFQMMNMLT